MRKIGDGYAAGDRARASGKRLDELLYVEDDDDNFLVAELRLGESYRLVRAKDAEEACRAVRHGSAAIRAILMDVELRGSALNGIDLVRLFRGTLVRPKLPDYAVGLPTLSVPILFVTAHGAKHDEKTLLAAGADRLVTKPVDFGELTLALTQLHLARIGGRRT